MRSMNTYYKFLSLLAALFLFATCKKTNETIADFQLRVSGIVPDSGYSNTLVTIKGENFSLILAEDSVAFNGVPARINLATDTTLQVYAPVAGTTGKVLVKVGENKSAGPVFTYVILPQQNPQITALSPSSALPFSTVTISGHNFSSIASLDNVQFGALKATVLRADRYPFHLFTQRVMSRFRLRSAANPPTRSAFSTWLMDPLFPASIPPTARWERKLPLPGVISLPTHLKWLSISMGQKQKSYRQLPPCC